MFNILKPLICLDKATLYEFAFTQILIKGMSVFTTGTPFWVHILSACFYKEKNFFNTILTLNGNFLYYWQCRFNNVMFP